MKRYIHAFLLYLAGFLLSFFLIAFFFVFEISDTFYSFFVYGAVLEELFKFAVALIALRFGVKPLTTAFIGAGFGLGEQLVLFRLYDFAVMGLIAPWMHIITGVLMAWLLKRAVEQKTFKSYLIAFSAPLAVHALYNQFLAIILWWYTS